MLKRGSTSHSTHRTEWSAPEAQRAEPKAAVRGYRSELQQHASVGMVNIKNKKCRTMDCGKRPSFGVAGTDTVKYCQPHALDGMFNGNCK